jgi:lipopolysaccharide biosynthesis glycosyltransferase
MRNSLRRWKNEKLAQKLIEVFESKSVRVIYLPDIEIGGRRSS